MNNIKKWACVPKIKVEVYDESEDDQSNSIDFFQEVKIVKEEKVCKKFSFRNNVFGHRTELNKEDNNEKRKIRPIISQKSKCKMLGVDS